MKLRNRCESIQLLKNFVQFADNSSSFFFFRSCCVVDFNFNVIYSKKYAYASLFPFSCFSLVLIFCFFFFFTLFCFDHIFHLNCHVSSVVPHFGIVFLYVSSIYKRFQDDEFSHVMKPGLLNNTIRYLHTHIRNIPSS